VKISTKQNIPSQLSGKGSSDRDYVQEYFRRKHRKQWVLLALLGLLYPSACVVVYVVVLASIGLGLIFLLPVVMPIAILLSIWVQGSILGSWGWAKPYWMSIFSGAYVVGSHQVLSEYKGTVVGASDSELRLLAFTVGNCLVLLVLARLLGRQPES
jgi:hypothetical protein